MEWITFWTAFGAVSQLLGAIATVAAVVVALRLARQDSIVDARFTVKKDSVDHDGRAGGNWFMFHFFNYGRRPIFIDSWGMRLGNGVEIRVRISGAGSQGTKLEPYENTKWQLTEAELSAEMKSHGLGGDISDRFYLYDQTGTIHYATVNEKMPSDPTNRTNRLPYVFTKLFLGRASQ
jgi:hypothetical protein